MIYLYHSWRLTEMLENALLLLFLLPPKKILKYSEAFEGI